MTREVHEIPPARRSVRWGSLAAVRWPLGLAGGVLAVAGGLVAWMLLLSRGVLADEADLDRGAVRGHATVTGVQATDARIDGVPAERVTYSFETDDGIAIADQLCWARRDQFAAGSVQPVEYLATRPEVNRLIGARLCLLTDRAGAVFRWVCAPGLLLLLLWAAGVWRQQRMLAAGDVTVALPTRIERVAGIVPVTLRVHYRFRDHNARWCEGWHWVRARSELGGRLTAMRRELVLVHDRRRPELNRLVIASDFHAHRRQRAEGEPAQRV